MHDLKLFGKPHVERAALAPSPLEVVRRVIKLAQSDVIYIYINLSMKPFPTGKSGWNLWSLLSSKTVQAVLDFLTPPSPRVMPVMTTGFPLSLAHFSETFFLSSLQHLSETFRVN